MFKYLSVFHRYFFLRFVFYHFFSRLSSILSKKQMCKLYKTHKLSACFFHAKKLKTPKTPKSRIAAAHDHSRSDYSVNVPPVPPGLRLPTHPDRDFLRRPSGRESHREHRNTRKRQINQHKNIPAPLVKRRRCDVSLGRLACQSISAAMSMFSPVSPM